MSLELKSKPSSYIFFEMTQEEREKEQGERWMRSEARVSQLLSEKHALAEELRATEHSLRIQRENWQKERSKAIALMFSKFNHTLAA